MVDYIYSRVNGKTVCYKIMLNDCTRKRPIRKTSYKYRIKNKNQYCCSQKHKPKPKSRSVNGVISMNMYWPC